MLLSIFSILCCQSNAFFNAFMSHILKSYAGPTYVCLLGVVGALHSVVAAVSMK